MDLFEALQLRAAKAYLEPDHEAWLRRIFRYYSKNFHVPLPEVEALPLEHVLTTYYEDVIAQMDTDAREEAFDWLAMTEEERERMKKEEKVKEEKDDEFFESLNSEVKKGMTKGPPKERPKFKPPVVKKPLSKPPPAPPGPDIKMRFDSNLMEAVGNLDPLAPPPRKPIL